MLFPLESGRIWFHFHLTEDRTPSFQSLSGISGTDLRILDRGGPKFTQYNVETVFQLIASTSSQFSVMHGASMHIYGFRFFECLISVNLFKERGYRLSRRHISESRCLCKSGTGFRPLEGSRKKCKFEQVFYLVERRNASFQLKVICDPSVVGISVSSH